jgi:hypothetical protein
VDSSAGSQALEIFDQTTGTPRATVLKTNDEAAQTRQLLENRRNYSHLGGPYEVSPAS